jgi:hypothetical protein
MLNFLSSHLNDCNQVGEAEGATLLSLTATMAHHSLTYRGKVEIPKHENQQSTGLVQGQGRGYSYSRTTLQSVYTCTQPGMVPGRCTADRAHPTVQTLSSYGLNLHPTPFAKGIAPE